MSGQFRENWKRMAAKDANRYHTGDDKDVVRFEDQHLLTTNASGLQGIPVDSTAPTDGQTLVYNSVTQEYVASGVASAADLTSVISDIVTVSGLIGTEIAGQPVEAGTPASGEGIRYDGSQWSFMPFGRLIQHVYVEDSLYASSTGTTIAHNNNAPGIADGAQAFTLNITPTQANSIILCVCQLNVGDAAGGTVTSAIFRDSTLIQCAAVVVAATTMETLTSVRASLAGGTTEQVWQVRYGSDIGVAELNGVSGAGKYNGRLWSNMHLFELML